MRVRKVSLICEREAKVKSMCGDVEMFART